MLIDSAQKITIQGDHLPEVYIYTRYIERCMRSETRLYCFIRLL